MKEVILSPGSRCAPLTLAFVRHPLINTRTISDERSAAFIALGISQQSQNTTCLVCTSGSAAYNYAPAIAEAYYENIPLLILTADRPPEWIGQRDGQTIQQENIYGKHVKASYSLPVDYNHPDSRWHIERIINEAINISQEYPKGPVHVNIPLREPFYPEGPIVFDKHVKIFERIAGEPALNEQTWIGLLKIYGSCSKVLIVGGQTDPESSLCQELSVLSEKQSIPVVGDIISNLYQGKTIRHHDVILSSMDEGKIQALCPDLLITFGRSVISKNLKMFLRKNKPAHHWHIQLAGHVSDTYQSLTRIISVSPQYFIRSLNDQAGNSIRDAGFKNLWEAEERKASAYLTGFFARPNLFNEFGSLSLVFRALPENSILHLANSMPVRYANYLGLPQSKSNISIYANRGTSGIDGVISTAVGAALCTRKTVTVITGDMAFFYDRNAFWNNYIPSNLRIVILNNHGGGIFRMIDGPGKQPELAEYFETKQNLIADNTAKDFNLDYSLCKDEMHLTAALEQFFMESPRSKILEIETGSSTNTEVFKNFKSSIP